MDHVHHLAEKIGPRGSTTPSERAATEYAANVFKSIGLEPQVETFTSATSAWRPFAVATGITLATLPLYFLDLRWPAALIALGTTICVVLELTFTSNPLRWLIPHGQSQNVHAVIPARGERRQQLVLCGHLDTHRTPWAFSSRSALRIYRFLVTAGFVSAVLISLVLLIGAISRGTSWDWLVVFPAVLVGAAFAMSVQADLTPYSPGANDNATGAGVVLSLAERLQNEPLNHTEVWALCNGCEEVGTYGAAAFVRNHRQQLAQPFFIVIDSVGGKGTGPCYLRQETMLLPFKSDPGLIQLTDQVAIDHPELRAYRWENFQGNYTDGAPAIKAGWRVLSFVNLLPDGSFPHWHQSSDICEHVDKDVVQRTETFVWELLKRIDRGTKPRVE